MKKSDKYLIFLFAICSLILVNSCRKETEEPEIKPDENIGILEGQALIHDEFSKNLSSSTLETAITNTLNWVKSQPYVASAKSLYNGIEVKYKSGMIGIVAHFDFDNNGKIISGKNGTEIITEFKNFINLKKSPSISKDNAKSSGKIQTTANLPVGNKKVLIWSPFQEDFNYNLAEDAEEIFAQSDVELEIDIKANHVCTVSSILEFEKYGLILIDTHGSQGKYFSTREEATGTNINQYEEYLKHERLIILSYKDANGNNKNYYQGSYKFIKEYCGLTESFPNSIVFNGSCESTMCDSLSNAFISKGAKTYYGFDKPVSAGFVVLTAKAIVELLTEYYFNTGQSYAALYDPWGKYNAKIEIKGNKEVAYLPPFWQGYFQYEQDVDVTYGYTSWSIHNEANFNLKLTMDDPYLSFGVFTQSDLTGSLSIDWKRTNSDVNVTCTASCSSDIEALVVFLWVSSETDEYELTIAFDNSRPAGGTPCSGSCSNGSSIEVTNGIYLNEGNWPVSLGPVPTYSTYTGDIISGTWTGPAPAPDDGGISPYDGCVIKWYLTKMVP
ncbi:MAG: hypothetical protein JXN62_08235 [Bacteroidales bacterium]|nr:hypothetical protein [Bacteroidales bacterium]